MSVKQFSATYSLIEDRIIFGFNTTEGELYQFLITRVIAKLFIDQGEKSAEDSLGSQHNERSSKLISEFQKEGLRRQLNFEEKFEGGELTPLGKDPILVTQVVLETLGDEVHISLTLLSNQVVGFKVAIVQLQALILLIEKLAHQAMWQINPDQALDTGTVKVVCATPSSQLH